MYYGGFTSQADPSSHLWQIELEKSNHQVTHHSGGMFQRNRIQQTLTVDEKADKNLWWEGPKYLKTKPPQWPVNRASKETVPEGELKKQDKRIKRTPQGVM